MTAAEEIETVEAAIACARAVIEEAEDARAVAEYELRQVDALRAAAAVGDRSSEEVEAVIAGWEADRDAATATIERNTGILAPLEERLAGAKHAAAVEYAAEVEAVYQAACEPRNEALAKCHSIAVAAVKQARAAARERSTVSELRLLAERAARAAGVTVDLVDEPDWRPDGWETIVELFQDGPHTPAADAAERAEAAAAQRQVEQEAAIRQQVLTVARESFRQPRRGDESITDAVRRLMDEHGVDDTLFDDVVDERRRIAVINDRKLMAEYEEAAETWRAAGGEPPPFALDEFKIEWRRWQELDHPDGSPLPGGSAPDQIEAARASAGVSK